MKRYIAYLICILFAMRSFCFSEQTHQENTYFIHEQGLSISKYLHRQEIGDTAISPDGRIAAVAINDSAIRFVYLDGTDGEIPSIGRVGQVRHMTFSPDGKYLAFTSPTFQIWDYHRKEKVYEIKPDGQIGGCFFSFLNDSQRIIIYYMRYMGKGSRAELQSDFGDTIRICNFITNSEEKVIPFGNPHYNYFKLSPDGNYWAGSSVGGSGEILIWDVRTGEVYKKYPAEGMKHTPLIEGFTFSNDGKMLLVAIPRFPETGGRASGRRIIMWDIETKEIVSRLDVDDTFYLRVLSLSKDGKRLFMAGSGIIHVYDINEHRSIIKTDPIIPGKYTPACFNPEKELVAFGTPYESHWNKDLRCLLICKLADLSE